MGAENDETVIDPVAENETVRGFVARLSPGNGAFSSIIDARDGMYRYNLESLRGCSACAAILYYLKGHQIFSTVCEIAAWRFGGLENVRSMLDVGSGWGRVTRFLIRELPPERIWVAEIRSAAVLFQEAAFGVRGFVTGTEPGSLDPGQNFESIVAASFFSHLPEGRFRGWMRQLLELLTDEGLLLFSTHGASLLKTGSTSVAGGIAFLPESEATDLEISEYGTSYVTEDFVRHAVTEATGGRGRARGFPRGLCGFQDLYVVTKNAEIDLESLRVTYVPAGDLDRSALPEGRLALEGWASDANGSHSLAAVKFTVNNREVAAWTPSRAADTRTPQRWSFDVDRSGIAPDDVLIVSALNDAGLQNILSMGTLRPYLAPAQSTA